MIVGNNDTDDCVRDARRQVRAEPRPSFADVVGISLRTRKVAWRIPDSTATKAHRLDARTGRKTGEFALGDSPHENNYAKEGRLIRPAAATAAGLPDLAPR